VSSPTRASCYQDAMTEGARPEITASGFDDYSWIGQTARVSSAHDRTVLDQFTKQAVPFATAPIHQEGLDLILAAARVTRADDVLDVACGPGIMACAVARHARHVTGVDMTPRMIEESTATATRSGVENVTWIVGTATPLPLANASFSVVMTRFSFHHFADPAAALAEMFRVCCPGGRVVVADLSIPAPEGLRFDAVERWRDPSHVHALSPEELRALFAAYPVSDLEEASFGLDLELEPQLTRSFPVEGGADKVRRAYADSVSGDTLGIKTRVVNGSIWSTWPVRVISATNHS
jgi:SAM-dependent methyltransferase